MADEISDKVKVIFMEKLHSMNGRQEMLLSFSKALVCPNLDTKSSNYRLMGLFIGYMQKFHNEEMELWTSHFPDLVSGENMMRMIEVHSVIVS
jgi:hypothetical protein